MMEEHDNEAPRIKRFKHQSYNEQLREVHLPSTLTLSKADADEDESSQFHVALTQCAQLNLSPAFLSFARKATPLSESLPLLLHHNQDIVDTWLQCIEAGDDEALGVLFELLQKLVHDLRKTLLPTYNALLEKLLFYMTRPIPPTALTNLLAALSVLFKHVLVPTPDALQSTWDRYHETLEQCNSEVQRAGAEVWALVLRRLKKEERARCVQLMVTNENVKIDDMLSWSFIFAMKSVAQTTHTCTAHLLTVLIDCHLASETESLRVERIIRRVLTALVHHCSKPEHYTVLADVLLDKLAAVVESEDGVETKRRMLEIVGIPCAVRKGSRLSTKQLACVPEMVMKLPIQEALRDASLRTVTAALIASPSDLSIWIGPGRRIIDHAWSSSPEFAVRLTGTLVEADWGGFRQFALTPFLKHALALLDHSAHRLVTLRVLAKLSKQNLLKGTDGLWRTALSEWISAWLKVFTLSEDSVQAFREIMTLEPILSSSLVMPGLVDLLSGLAALATTLEEAYSESWANEAWVTGVISLLISKRPQEVRKAGFNLIAMVNQVVSKWSWSESAMSGLAELVKAIASPSDGPKPEPAVLELLFLNLKSYSQIIRQSALEILTCLYYDDFGDVPKRCLSAESVPLSVQGVRERILRIGRVGQVVKDGDTRSANLCILWLIGQLKVNLRPIWSPSAGAIAALSQRFPDTVWSLIFKEIQNPLDGLPTTPLWSLQKDSNDGESETIDTKEAERSWRDPSAHKLRSVVRLWASDDRCRCQIIEEQSIRDRIDPLCYEAQLISTLVEMPSLAERHGRDLIPHFLSFASHSVPVKSSRARLSDWLGLFAKFSNPKALYSSSALMEVYVKLLAHADRTLQSLALKCILTYKSAALLKHEDTFNLLLDDTKWRDQVASLEIGNLDNAERVEVVPILIRLFYGMMTERTAHGRGAGRRAALLGALVACSANELDLLVDLMLDPFRGPIDYANLQAALRFSSVGSLDVPGKQQVGFLTLLGDVLRHLNSRLSEQWPRLLVTALMLTAHAQKVLGGSQELIQDGDDESEEKEDAVIEEQGGSSRQLRTIRQLGLKRIADFFRSSINFDFTPYLEHTFRYIISPRIELLDCENIQAPSALLDLFDVWAQDKRSAVFLVQYDKRTLSKIYDCLVARNVKPTVLSRVFDIVDRLLAYSDEDEGFGEVVIKPYMSGLLANMTTLVHRTAKPGTAPAALAHREITVLSSLAPHIVDGEQAATLLSLFLPQLRKPLKVVPERVKADILKIVSNIIPIISNFDTRHEALRSSAYDTLALLFQSLRGRSARTALTHAFHSLAVVDSSLASIADLLESLNSYSSSRIEEPDFDRRLTAFARINEDLYRSFSGKSWTPILYNTLYFVQDDGELSIRTNASLTMKRFIEVFANNGAAELQTCFAKVLYPGVKRGLLSKSDAVRSEIIGVLGFAVSQCENVEELKQMRVLLADGDEEANFFNNVYHIQLHRRMRALRRLADFCDSTDFRSSVLEGVLLPIVNGFILGAGTVDHHLVNEAIHAVGRIAHHLAWSAYHSLVQQYLKPHTDNATLERVSIRALVAILDQFHFSMDDSCAQVVSHSDEDDAAVQDFDAQILKWMTRIHDSVSDRLLPSLLKHLEQRHETEDSNRIPIAIGIARISLHLPEPSRSLQVTKLLTVLAQVFRSKSQETRDLARETLCRITISLGPAYLCHIVRQLREALMRGPQLHVLAFVIHALLVHVTSAENTAQFNNLDDCVADVVHVSAEVVFGQSGKDVETEGFKTKMKEVRRSTSKGLDSFAIISKFITPASLAGMLKPLKAIMSETESFRSMQRVDDVLRRMSSGINANAHFGPAEVLVFCHTLITQNARFFHDQLKPRKTSHKRSADDVIVQMKRQTAADNDHYVHNAWRFVCFGLDLFNTAYGRGRFDFQDGKIISRLEPMVAAIGNTLYSTNGQVIASGLKAMAQIVKCPLKSIDKSVPVFVKQTMDIIRGSGSTESETAQTAFKSLATVIRDCPSAHMKEKDLTHLLDLITPDLEEASRQAAAFSLLRAIIARKFVVSEIYDLMDRVSEIMVTNQSSQVQELCRSALLQFLLDYPQGKGRLKNQIAFLVKNLSYVYESGRMSVMELLNAVILKFHDDIIEEHAEMFFVALVMIVANDEIARCREMAAQLIKLLVSRLSADKRAAILAHAHTWAIQSGHSALSWVSSQVYGIILDALKKDILPFLPVLLDDVNAKILEAAEEFTAYGEGEVADDALKWQSAYHALTTTSRVLHVFAEVLPQHEKIDWVSITTLLLYPHAWVRLASARLLGTLFSAVPVAAPSPSLDASFPLSVTGMVKTANSLSLQLKSENLTQALSLQIVKNLFFVGKCFCASLNDVEPSQVGGQYVSDSDEEAEEEVAEESDPVTAPLPWLFSRLSYQVRSAYIKRRRNSLANNWTEQPSAIFRWFAAMATYMEAKALERFLTHILSPVYRITEDDTIREAAMDELKTLGLELQELVRNKVGTTQFTAVYSRIRQSVQEIRRDRRTARAVQVATNPEAVARRKAQRYNVKKESKKRRSRQFAATKTRVNTLKRRKVAE